ncbi:MAG TPA: thioredoxin domain-containing protein [Candidatus Gracilibacteria bacterium]|nr:thioredoxin domain-containing protein [Candidatus Gracilibacteria bacterium]
MAKKSNKSFYFKISVLALIVFAGGFLIGSITNSEDCSTLQANTTADKKAADKIETQEIDLSNSAYLGEEEAPITMIEFTDYECPFCQRYYFGAFEDIMEKYIKTGKVKYVTKSLPLDFHENARPAAYASYCAGEQNALWDMHGKLFTYQNEWAYEDDPTDEFTKYAGELKLNQNAFTECLKTAPKNYDKTINEDMALASKNKIKGTPSFLINGQLIVGAQPFQSFENIIESLL